MKLLAPSAALALTACNTFTGASGLGLDDVEEGTHGLADGVTITRLDLVQGVHRPLMEAGSPATSSLPLVSERESLFRIHYTAEAPTSLTARLTIGEAEPIEVPATAVGTSTEAVLASTINLPIPAESLIGSTYRVELLQPIDETSGDNEGAAHPPPEDDPAPLPLQSSGPLELVVVPIRYDADGSGRLPDTSEGQLAILRESFQRVFPVPEVEIRIAEPMPWSSPVSGIDVNGWSFLLDEVTALRASQGAPPGEYYLGLFRAAETFGDFCSSGCITGLSNVVESPGDAFGRASIAVGYAGQASADTAVHEVGHAHGRRHAPCGGASSIDPAFPNSDGSIGAWGYDFTAGALVDPSTADFMSYCEPTWVSPYNWEALFTRGQLVNVALKSQGIAEAAFDRILVLADGTAHFRGRTTIAQPAGGMPTPVRLDDHEVEGRFFRFDHAEAGILLVPASDARTIRFATLGRTHEVER